MARITERQTIKGNLVCDLDGLQIAHRSEEGFKKEIDKASKSFFMVITGEEWTIK